MTVSSFDIHLISNLIVYIGSNTFFYHYLMNDEKNGNSPFNRVLAKVDDNDNAVSHLLKKQSLKRKGVKICIVPEECIFRKDVIAF